MSKKSSLSLPTFHDVVSKRAQLAHLIGPLTVKPVLGHTPLISPIFLGLRSIDAIANLYPGPKSITRTTVDTPTWTAHLYEPHSTVSKKVLVYFHGGAFISGGLGTHRSIVERLVLANECAVLSVAYRQFPKVKFDTTVQDCREAIGWVLEQGHSISDIVIAGDSAGGGLALRVAGDILKDGQSVGGVISLSGWLDFDSSAKKAARRIHRDAYVPVARLEAVARLILGRHPEPEDSPLASLQAGFPPLLLIYGAREILRVDSDRAYEICEELGIYCESHYFKGGVHSFPVAAKIFPEGIQALQIMKTFIESLDSYPLD